MIRLHPAEFPHHCVEVRPHLAGRHGGAASRAWHAGLSAAARACRGLATVAFGVLSTLLGRRGLLTWCAAVLLCVSVAVLIAAHLLSVVSQPYWYERRSVPELLLWVLAYVAMPLAAVGYLATRGARKWCLNRDKATTPERDDQIAHRR